MSYGGDGGQRGFRINPRIIVAVLIALGAVFTYFMNTSTNPVTGEKQHVAMNPQQEIAMGLQAAPEMAEKMGGKVDPRDPEAREVDKVGRQLADKSDASKPEDPYRGHFEFHLLADDKTINAFALPGGQIFITRALYSKLQNEAQLAGVLGHEMGHVINRHSAQQMAKGQLGQLLTSAVAVGASDPDHRGRGQMAAAAAAMANQMLQLRYSRGDESEADTYGLRYMTQAGYDPGEMLGVMRILKDAGGAGGGPEFLQTHPLPETRLEEIAQILKEKYSDREGLTKGRSLPGAGRSAGEEESDWR